MCFLRCFCISLFALVLMGASSQAKENIHIKVEGTSTMHNWEAESDVIEESVKINGSKLAGSVDIPANSFKSHSSDMDKNMFTALKAQKYPEIMYKFLTVRVINGMNDQQYATLETKGDLTIAGVKHTIILPFKIKKLSDNRMEITGSYKLKMTDYGITIPKFLFGMVQTGDAVEVSWDWMISLK
jgi:polyisoprenoid-binding protein YceI